MPSASFNKVILLGNLTRDIELRYTSGGTAVTDLGMAVNERRKVGDDWKEETTFVDVTLWGRTAEVAGEYLNKGSLVMIEGRLQRDTWETEDGQKRSKMKVVGQRMQMIGGQQNGGGAKSEATPEPAAEPEPVAAGAAASEGGDVPPF